MLAIILSIELIQLILTPCIMDSKTHFEVIKLTKTERYLIVLVPLAYILYYVIKEAINFIHYPTEL